MKKFSFLTMSILVLEALTVSSATAQSNQCNWAGNWETSRGTVNFSQSGKTIAGKSVELGDVTAITYRGKKWCELYGVFRDSKTQKQGEFKLLQNGDSFTGQWQTHRGRAWAHSWTGTKLSTVDKQGLIKSDLITSQNSMQFGTLEMGTSLAVKQSVKPSRDEQLREIRKKAAERTAAKREAYLREKEAKEKSNYKQRERSAYSKTDYCGPSFLTKHIGSSISGPFIHVCKQHDACYRLGEKSQRFCDNQMKVGMDKVCQRRPWYEQPRCQTHASIFGRLIETTIGGQAFEGAPQGEIIDVQRNVIEDYLSDDEVDYCVTIHNNSKITQEYEVRLVTAGKRIVDREPDSYEANVLSNARKTICVGTDNLPQWSQSDLSSLVYIQLLADTPEGWSVSNDLVHVDTRTVQGR